MNCSKRLSLYSPIIIIFYCSILAAYNFSTYKVERIIDGDTVWVQPTRSEAFWELTPMAIEGNPQTRIKIRMMGIDAPESHLPTENYGVVGQHPWGEKATETLESLIHEGLSVKLIIYGTDKYGRTLAYVYYKNNDINLSMISNGQAIPYIICTKPYCNKNFFSEHNVFTYFSSCASARKARKGIFNPQKPLKEMPFEFRMRMMEKEPDKYVGDFFTKELFEPEDYNKVDLCSRVFFYSYNDALALGFEWGKR